MPKKYYSNYEIAEKIDQRDKTPVGRKIKDTYGGRLSDAEGRAYGGMTKRISNMQEHNANLRKQYEHEKAAGGARTDSFEDWLSAN